jgi:hypothetical protein
VREAILGIGSLTYILAAWCSSNMRGGKNTPKPDVFRDLKLRVGCVAALFRTHPLEIANREGQSA